MVTLAIDAFFETVTLCGRIFKIPKETYFFSLNFTIALVTQSPVSFSNLGLGSTIATVPSGKASVERVQVKISEELGFTVND